jgi:hypothetical protein
VSELAPPWPTAETPEELGFVRQPPVRWLSPGELVQAGLRVVLSGIFGTYADKRELQAALAEARCHDFSDGDELWIDYAADLGDGFDATYTIASLLAEEKLDLRGGRDNRATVESARGRVLILGGDQVYPTASIDAYRNRFEGPYRAALPYTERDHPAMFAVPGNHDWYDGLTSFVRVLCQGNWIGGWKTHQTRSYFALRLPHRWWLWAIDIQFDSYIDEPQLRFFREVVGPQVEPGDSVILCSAKPNWVQGADEPEAFQTLDYFERRIVRDTCRANVRLSLTGDSHHYARYHAPATDAHRIIAGGGGAFLSATHHLPPVLELPPMASKDPGKTRQSVRFEREATYPTIEQSRRLRRGIWRLPLLNPTFAVLVGVIYLAYGWLIQSAGRSANASVEASVEGISFWDAIVRLARTPLALVVTAALAFGMAGFTKAHSPALKWGVGLAHLAAHLAAAATLTWLLSRSFQGLDGAVFVIALVVGLFLVGAVVGSLVMALYLALVDRLKLNTNELFAAQRIEDHKNFLRLRIDPDGRLEVYPIVVDRIDRKWRLRREGERGNGGGGWFVSDQPGSGPRLIGDPIRIAHAPAPPPHVETFADRLLQPKEAPPLTPPGPPAPPTR